LRRRRGFLSSLLSTECAATLLSFRYPSFITKRASMHNVAGEFACAVRTVRWPLFFFWWIIFSTDLISTLSEKMKEIYGLEVWIFAKSSSNSVSVRRFLMPLEGLRACPKLKVNVWRPNIIKHCLVTKQADVEVSGQTVKTCLIKHRSNYRYKPVSKGGTHAHAKQVWYRFPNEQNIAHQTREQKKCFKLFDRMFDGLQILSQTTKHDQTRSNTIKHDKTESNRIQQGGQTVKCLVTKQCFMVFRLQTFPVSTALYLKTLTAFGIINATDSLLQNITRIVCLLWVIFDILS